MTDHRQPGEADKCVVDAPYLLVLNLGVILAPDGEYYVDRSWAKDLLRHTDYLPQLTYLAPMTVGNPPEDFQIIPKGQMRIVVYRNRGGRLGSYLALTGLLRRLLQEIPRSQFVHTAIAGYPIPVGWIAVPLARMMGKKIVLPVESSFWRIPSGATPGLRRRLSAFVWERVNRACMRQADFAAYPHEDYRLSLPAPRAGGGVLFQASWIDRDAIREKGDVEEMWNARVTGSRLPRFLFAARMVREKGTQVLVDAIERLGKLDAELAIDIIGTGPDLEILKASAKGGWGQGHVKILDPVPYGPDFFRLLREYDAVLVPGLSDEQPRIVYDAYSQGVPAIVSDMPGHAVCVEDGLTGRVTARGDSASLADAMISAAVDTAQLRIWGLAAREMALLHTHDRMHEDRCRELQKLI